MITTCSPVSPSFAMPVFSPLACSDLSALWTAVSENLSNLPSVRCRDNQCELFDLNAKVEFSRLAPEQCSIHVDQSNSDVKTVFSIEENRNAFSMENAATQDFIKASTDFKDSIEASWRRTSKDFLGFEILPNGELGLKEDIKITQGSFKIEGNPGQDEVAFHFEDGVQAFSGTCNLGVNELTCNIYDENKPFFHFLDIGKKVVLAAYSKTCLEDGKVLRKFDLTSPSFLIFPEKKLGSFEVVFGSQGQFEMSAAVNSLNPDSETPFFSGKLSGDSNAKEFSAHFTRSNIQTDLEQKVVWNAAPHNFSGGIRQKIAVTDPENKAASSFEYEAGVACDFQDTGTIQTSDCSADLLVLHNGMDVHSYQGAYLKKNSETGRSIEAKIKDCLADEEVAALEVSHNQDEKAHRYNGRFESRDGTEFDVFFKRPK